MIDIIRFASKKESTVRIWCLISIVACTLPSCSSARLSSGSGDNTRQATYANCVLPGQVRQLGTRLTYLTPKRPVNLSESECHSRGGQFVVADKAEQLPDPVAGRDVEIRWGEMVTDESTVYSVLGVVTSGE